LVFDASSAAVSSHSLPQSTPDDEEATGVSPGIAISILARSVERKINDGGKYAELSAFARYIA
jgi:hypothetical protein